MAQFKRGIRNPEMMQRFEELAAKQSWWRDVLQDKNLVIGVRDDYLNVYWRGQSLFKVEMKRGKIVASTHPKYLLDPDVSRPIGLDPDTVTFDADPDQLLTRCYVGAKTLGKLKRAAELYEGFEKCGVQDITEANANVADVEIAFSNGSESRSVPRIDIATFETDHDGVELAFWEAKLFGNPELHNKKVVSQITNYNKLIARERDCLIESYQVIAGNLTAFAKMSGGVRSVADEVRRVADGAPLRLADPARVRLVVFGFNQKEKDDAWKPLLHELKQDLDSIEVVARGASKGLKLRR